MNATALLKTNILRNKTPYFLESTQNQIFDLNLRDTFKLHFKRLKTKRCKKMVYSLLKGDSSMLFLTTKHIYRIYSCLSRTLKFGSENGTKFFFSIFLFLTQTNYHTKLKTVKFVLILMVPRASRQTKVLLTCAQKKSSAFVTFLNSVFLTYT